MHEQREKVRNQNRGIFEKHQQGRILNKTPINSKIQGESTSYFRWDKMSQIRVVESNESYISNITTNMT